jgi:hypothetical protein
MEKSVNFLGYVLSSEGIRTSPEKVEAITAMQRPNNVLELMSFLGLVNFYRSFVPRFAGICEPLYNLTQKEVVWNWNKDCQSAFDEVKRTLSSSEVLVHFDQNLPIGLSCDASPVGIGAVLFHVYPDGKERPITSVKVRKFSSRDKILSTVFRLGWPSTMSKSDPLYQYYLHRNEYTIVQGIILWGVRVVVPAGLQKLLLSELHAGHFGIVRMKSLARVHLVAKYRQ